MGCMIQREFFGRTHLGQEVNLFTLKNRHGLKVQITNYGGIVVSLLAPDQNGDLDDIVLGLDTFDDYLNRNDSYFGAVVGRFCNRIEKAQFSLDGLSYQLSKNEGMQHLHGGFRGFSQVVWEAETIEKLDQVTLRLNYLSQHGEEGYPGNLYLTVDYSLSEKNELRIDYLATTDRPTILNLTHHSYFNLSGHGQGQILHHELKIDADSFLPIDSHLIPSGSLQSVVDTPFDFREFFKIGKRIDSDSEQLKIANGYDHCFVLKGQYGVLRWVAEVRDLISGRQMEVLTTEPGLHLYTGNFLNERLGKAKKSYSKNFGFCLETQHYPNSPNQPDFPSTVLRPNEEFRSTTTYRFSTIAR